MPIITVSLANSICSSQDKQQAIKRVAERLTESTVRVLHKNSRETGTDLFLMD